MLPSSYYIFLLLIACGYPRQKAVGYILKGIISLEKANLNHVEDVTVTLGNLILSRQPRIRKHDAIVMGKLVFYLITAKEKGHSHGAAIREIFYEARVLGEMLFQSEEQIKKRLHELQDLVH
ncbi:MAG: hypothetical protein IT292_06910 [Deltaproteobacteria bacterium]|nr:hypothetical protein [Deltaproteobacteria bacterium]